MKSKIEVSVNAREEQLPTEVIAEGTTYRIEDICLLEPIMGTHKDSENAFD